MTRSLEATFERQYRSGSLIAVELQQPADVFSVTALLGPSGCGKTTVLRCLAGLDMPVRGRIAFGDDVWFDSSRGVSHSPQRRGIGYLSQHYALFPHLTATHNVAFGLRRLSTGQRDRRVSELLALFQLDGLGNRYPRQLSGGQQQRVALARTVAGRPRLLLLDEPLSALDTPTRIELRKLLRGLLAKLEIPTLIVTHDPVEVSALAENVIVMLEGRVRQSGRVDAVRTNPVDSAVARLLGVPIRT